MPKFETKEKFLFSLLGREYTDDELEQVFPRAKAELDEHDKENGVFKIELNDTNRPDLWSAMGLARLLKNYEDPQIKQYDFFSSKCFTADNKGRELHVGNRAKEVREFSCGFVAKGKTVDEDILLTLIQSQEKLCFNFGRKRKTIAMGIYRNDLITYPIHYDGADPDKTHFVPLHMEEDLSLREILEKHPKGQEYGYIIKDKPVYPYLYDDAGQTLSMPPIINSAFVGAVEVGDSNLFVEMSGPILKDILLCASIMAVDMADLGFEIEPVKVIYP
ncbi:MAG: phenylalanine--tRNA ligase subunit beta, partial [Spirochaetales bacterium]|nr:phenylalanine--tRNA ligase subunit beta [Spirochaetales bacterium]